LPPTSSIIGGEYSQNKLIETRIMAKTEKITPNNFLFFVLLNIKNKNIIVIKRIISVISHKYFNINTLIQKTILFTLSISVTEKKINMSKILFQPK